MGVRHNPSGVARAPALEIAAFTGGRDVPSARFRVRQYIEPLKEYGIAVTEFPALFGTYPPANRLSRPAWGVKTLVSRLPSIVRSYGSDLTILQREMLSTFATLEPLTRRPRVLDVDDAIWVYRGGKFAERLAKSCEAVICGNSFLAQQFGEWNSRVAVIPTAVDVNRFVPGEPIQQPVIGWSGTSGGFKYLYAIENALFRVLQAVPDGKLRIVSDMPPQFKKIPSERVEYIPWTSGGEVRALQGMAVGIMPLADSVWERGKCSYKMLTYMGCGLPVVVSPVGMNAEVLAAGECGLGAVSEEQWVSSLVFLLKNENTRRNMGRVGRDLVQKNFSREVAAEKLATALYGVIGQR